MKELEKKYTTLKENILKHIEKEKISPHTRLYFWLRTFVGVMGIGILLLTTVYGISLALFTLQKSGVLLLSPFGVFGVFSILNNLPWMLVFLSLFALFGLLLLAKNTFSVYRLPLLYLFLFAIGFVGISGFFVARTRVHPFLLDRLEKGVPEQNLKSISFYFSPEAHRISTGVLTSTTTDNGFMVVLDGGREVEVKTNEFTKYISRNNILAGDKVLIFGERRGSIIFAGAIREITDSDRDSIRMH